MNILFLTIGRMDSIESRGIYTDLLREFRDRGHNVYVVSQREKRTGLHTELIVDKGARMLRVRIGNITKCGRIEKGISTLRIEGQYLKAIKKYFKDVRFDLVMYSTPPITFVGAVEYIKKRDGAKTYLLLKDIFPQNAVDIGMMRTSGIYGLLYRYFRNKEKKLYSISDRIGCMSQANVDYVLMHNPEVSSDKVEVCPNSVDAVDFRVDNDTRLAMREKYGIPTGKKVFVYGGNLGKPQDIPFLIECLRTCKDKDDVYFLIVGDGTEYRKLEEYVNTEGQANLTLMKRLPKEDYDRLVGACDVGMIFLDHRFTIPNFPSRLLSYLQASTPVLACTDPNTDVGKVIVDGGFGWWCESNSTEAFSEAVDRAMTADLKAMGKKGYEYLYDNYTVAKSCDKIMKHFDI
ncbi:MAG: glycosyltransferase family 4 protein [Clostridia bacterium]|nr:glycosyltransferase family 4 protein [Clostridia bacterium]